MKTFRELGLSPEFVSMLEKAKIETPTEIQEKTIPLVMAGKDVIGGSATGSGKTLAFASGIIENLKKNERIQALILTPTRELAEQVAGAIESFSRYKHLKVLPVYGGVDIQNQIRRLRDTDIVVGTPGRILDHLNRGTLNLQGVKFLVLDEVDRMFDMGFQFDVERILKECPTKRQTMLFSATISSEIDHLSKKYTQNPEEVSVESYVDASKLKQVYYDVPDGLKFSLFVHLLKNEKAKLVMVFCGTRRNVDFVTENLNHFGIKAKATHGGMNQNKRTKVLDEFNSDKGVTVLVCTDVAARGLDISGVSHVYNYDLPKTSSEYIHRIGRTARAGEDGIAISVLCSRDYENFSNILRDEELKIEKLETPLVERVSIITSPRRENFRGRDDNRGSRSPRSGYDKGRSNSGRSYSKNKPTGNRSGSRDNRSDSSRDRPRNDRERSSGSSNRTSYGRSGSRDNRSDSSRDRPRNNNSRSNGSRRDNSKSFGRRR